MNRSLAVMAFIILSACTRSETETATSSSPATAETTATSAVPAAPAPAAQSRDVCAMITAEELKAATGIEGTGAPSRSGPADVCSWYGGPGAAIVQVYGSASDYERSRSSFESLYDKKAEELPGVGDRAFFIEAQTGSMPTATLSAVRGPNAISVQVMGPGADAATRKKMAVDLANVVLTKL